MSEEEGEGGLGRVPGLDALMSGWGLMEGELAAARRGPGEGGGGAGAGGARARARAAAEEVLDALDVVEAAEACDQSARCVAEGRLRECESGAARAHVELEVLNALLHSDGGEGGEGELIRRCADWMSRSDAPGDDSWEEEGAGLEEELAELKVRLMAETVRSMERCAAAKAALRVPGAERGGLWMDVASAGGAALEEDLVRRKF